MSFILKKHPLSIRRAPIRKYLFLEQNSPYYCQKPRKAAALLHFRLQYKQFLVLTKLRSTLKYKFWIQEKAKLLDNADAYRGALMHYCAKSSYFKEILPYGSAALCRFFNFNNLPAFIFLLLNLPV